MNPSNTCRGIHDGCRPAGRPRPNALQRLPLLQSTAASSEVASSEAAASADTTAAGKVYYLNFKPEQTQARHGLLAKTYTEETGVPVTVVTAASGQYETTLMSEMAKSDAPTLFQVNGPVGLANWKDYCYDPDRLQDPGRPDQRFLRPERWRRHRGHRLRYRELRPDHQQDPAGKGRLHHR